MTIRSELALEGTVAESGQKAVGRRSTASSGPWLSSCLLAFTAAALLCHTAARAEEFEAVSSRVSADYVRTKLPDGSFQPETYAFGKGGFWSGPINDKTIDRMDFMEIARTIAGPLADQHYVPAKDPRTTNLLIMVYWGTTEAPEHASDSATYNHLFDVMSSLPGGLGTIKSLQSGQILNNRDNNALTTAIMAVQADNRMRDNMDRRNALLLGYDSWWDATFDAQNGTALEVQKRDMLNELEEDRYFVVLMAYDFQLLQKEKKHKLLWETRFSIREHVNAFDQKLAAMTLEASKYFGRDSHGLTHEAIPEGRVEMGDVKNLGVVPDR